MRLGMESLPKNNSIFFSIKPTIFIITLINSFNPVTAQKQTPIKKLLLNFRKIIV